MITALAAAKAAAAKAAAAKGATAVAVFAVGDAIRTGRSAQARLAGSA